MTGVIRTGMMEIRVRYAECDPMGVAHHTAYPVWFEMGRTELLRETGTDYATLERTGVLLAVISLSVNYKRPAHYDELLQLTTTWMDSGRVKIRHAYSLNRGDEVLATAETTLACLDREGRPQPLPRSLAGPST